jgi:hypothetical protein
MLSLCWQTLTCAMECCNSVNEHAYDDSRIVFQWYAAFDPRLACPDKRLLTLSLDDPCPQQAGGATLSRPHAAMRSAS